MKIWIDADAAPREVKEIVFKAAKRLSVEAVLVANQWLSAPPGNPFVSVVRVEGGMDVADRYIAEQAEPGDLAVTADIPLAAKDFAPILEQIRKAVGQDLVSLENRLEAAGGPWTPGRIPTWKPE